jgi:hypothetical protein
MKKIIPVLLIGLLVFGGLGTAADKPDTIPSQPMIPRSSSTSIQLSSTPILSEKEETIQIEVHGMTSRLQEPNRPVLPIVVKVYQVPTGSKNIQVTCIPKNINTMTLTKKILSARISPLSKMSQVLTSTCDETIYNSSAFYPNTWYRYDIGSGRNLQNTKSLFVKIVCYPIRYSPANNQIEYATSFDVTLTYDAPIEPSLATETYDMVIIAPKTFESALQPLIDFKNTKGLKTTFKAVEDILAVYSGEDPPEQVKYFIKDAYDSWNITYVLLVGGLKSHLFAIDKDTRSAGWKAWWVPVRYVSIPEEDDEGCLSDLYYGCLYNATGGFDSWDSNGDGVYAAWGAPGALKDTFDMYPEVYVGRLPVTTKREVRHIVQKIITYESTGPEEKPWYKNFVGVGGKTFDYYAGKPDGEYLCDVAYNYTKLAVPNLNKVPVYSTNRNTSGLVPVAKDIQKAISQGAGYVDFEGHGNPLVWDTIWFDGTYPDDWCGGVNLYQFLKLTNKEKLPVVVVGGCHNGLYNVSLLRTLSDKTGANYFCYGIPIPVCFSWSLVLKYPGGAIASTGCTGYGMGYAENPVSLSGELESNFFYQIGNGSTNLGQAQGRAIQKFLSEEDIGQVEAFVITNWALFGDPSLLLGGYPS